MIPISSRAASRGSCVSESSVMQYLTPASASKRTDLRGEAGVGCAAHQPVEFFELAALPFPAHPHLLALVPLPIAVKQEEFRSRIARRALIEHLDARSRRGQDRLVVNADTSRRVGVVGEDRKVDPRVVIGDRHDFEMIDQRLDAGDARQQRRDDDDGPGFFGDAAGKLEPRQRFGMDETAGELLNERHRQLARRNQAQQRHRNEHRGRCAVPRRVANRGEHQQRRDHGNRSDVHDGRVRPDGASNAGLQLRAIPEIELEAGAARADQVIPDVGRDAAA